MKFTFLEKVKSQDDLCGIPFVLLTARADMQDKLLGLRIGVDAYKTKPFEAEELSLRIKNLLKNVHNRNDIALEVEPDEKTKRDYQPLLHLQSIVKICIG